MSRRKKYYLKEIQNPSRTYFYSAILNVVIGVVILTAGAAVFVLMELIFADHISGGYNVTVLQKAALHGCALLCAAPFFVWAVYVFVQIHRISVIMRRGKCYDGEISSFSMYGVYKGTELPRRNRHRNITLKIRYTINKAHYCHAGGFARNPNKVLFGKRCEVWKYDGMVFVTGFQIRKKGEPEVLIPRSG